MADINDSYENLTEEERREREKKILLQNEYYRIISESRSRADAAKNGRAQEVIRSLYANNKTELSEKQLAAAVEECRASEPDAKVQTVMFANFSRLFAGDGKAERIVRSINEAVNVLAETGGVPVNDNELNLLRMGYAEITDACAEYMDGEKELTRSASIAGCLGDFAAGRLAAVNRAEERSVSELNERIKTLAVAYRDAQLIRCNLECAGILQNKDVVPDASYIEAPAEYGKQLSRLAEIYETAKNANDKELSDSVKKSVTGILGYLDGHPAAAAACGKSGAELDAIRKTVLNQKQTEPPVVTV